MDSAKKERPVWLRLLSMFFNPWFWDLVYKRVLYWLFPSLDKTIKLNSPALDASLVSLDGKSQLSLLRDIINQMPRDMPLVLNMGSYN